jgi:hypothetical protein
MTSVLIVEKLGNIKELKIKAFSELELYKKAGFKNAEGFHMYAQWDIVIDDKKQSIRLFGKTTGRSMQENKYEFPPHVDKTLFFGNCVLINVVDDNIVSLNKPMWDVIYEKLHGGFIDTTNSEDSDSCESDDADIVLTKEGYAKDDFVVDTTNESEYDSSDTSDKYESPLLKKRGVTKKKGSSSSSSSTKTSTTAIDCSCSNGDDNNNNYMDCSVELDEEEYV